MDASIIELTSLCLEDLLIATKSRDTNKFFGLGHIPSYLPICQTYITTYLFNRLESHIKRKILSDDILNLLIKGIPYDVDQRPSNFLRHHDPFETRPYLIFSPEYENIGKKYNSDSKQITQFLFGKSDRWWTEISKKWRDETAKKIFSLTRHKKRQKDRSMAALINLPPDLRYLIITYL
jgi:serine/threonine protein kinase